MLAFILLADIASLHGLHDYINCYENCCTLSSACIGCWIDTFNWLPGQRGAVLCIRTVLSNACAYQITLMHWGEVDMGLS